MERVLGLDQAEDETGRTEVIDLAARPWLAGMTLSAIQLTVGDVSTAPGPRRKRRRF